MNAIEYVTALDVINGDIIYHFGYRCEISNATTENGTARYTLHSAPSITHPQLLPAGYDGMTSGGNHLCEVCREVQ